GTRLAAAEAIYARAEFAALLDSTDRDYLDACRQLSSTSRHPAMPASQFHIPTYDPRPRGTRIFISYRRNDTKHIAGRIFDFLDREISGEQIHFDTTTFPIGMDFRTHIETSLQKSAGVLAILGRYWINPDWLHGRSWPWSRKKREDFVRTEIEF